ncbi:hypothetical protein LAJ19_10840 [Deinococcus taeanensis]|uniref:hypothetical protein n=1 Tax=Deinococcus taeanensis TaxID=2737050 RepID=UPI001CDB6166|nr:hypothetical protein [Deinococcus taeanensis]UBV42125.1 hypothetical protein LAJ19_10840 [Deinococcus taeanensis]
MKLRTLLDGVNLPDLIAEHCGPEAVRGLHRDRGGVIRDPRPGHTEHSPSFSVYLNAQGRWKWKRFGGDGGHGSAYDFLLGLGFTSFQAAEELSRWTGAALAPSVPAPSAARVPLDPLVEARHALSRCAPLGDAEQHRALRWVCPLGLQDAAGRALKERGLYGWQGLQAGQLIRDFQTRDGRTLAHAGALAFSLRGPDGRPWGLKVRNLGSVEVLRACGLERYVYRLGRYGSPAWCSPRYGTGEAVLIVEGELNGAAASRALSRAGVRVDVQGLAGANGTPFLEGLRGKPVYVYADPDAPGAACVGRVARMARAAGASAVRVLAPLADGDFCDLAGKLDIHAFGALLHRRIERADRWHPPVTGNIALPVNNALPHTQNDSWQTGPQGSEWGGEAAGWGAPATTWGGPLRSGWSAWR